MKKGVILVAIIVIAVLIYLALPKYAPYEKLNSLEKKYGLTDSLMPESAEQIMMLKAELRALQKSLEDEEGKQAEAVRVLVEIRLDLAGATENFFRASKYLGAISPFSDNCKPGKPVYEAKRLMEEALTKSKTASDRMKLFLTKYSAEAGGFGVNNNYAKEYADFLEESLLRDKHSLDAFC